MGGNNCGILQLSAEISQFNIHLTVTSARKDAITYIRIDATTFNDYVKPGRNTIWSDAASAVHGLYSWYSIVVSAARMPIVWADFCTWITSTKYIF